MHCKNICKKYHATEVPVTERYTHGDKRCTVCAIYIKYDGYFCPCCSSKLRVRPRSNRSSEEPIRVE